MTKPSYSRREKLPARQPAYKTLADIYGFRSQETFADTRIDQPLSGAVVGDEPRRRLPRSRLRRLADFLKRLWLGVMRRIRIR